MVRIEREDDGPELDEDERQLVADMRQLRDAVNEHLGKTEREALARLRAKLFPGLPPEEGDAND